MEQSRNGSRCDHSAEEPAVEGHLGSFGDTGKSKAGHGDGKVVTPGAGETAGQETGEFNCSANFAEEQNGEAETETAAEVHNKGAERVVDRFGSFGVTDQEERAQTGDFPEEVHPDQVIGGDNAEHCREENKHNEEEETSSVGFVFIVMLEVFHVAQRVDCDETPDDSDNQCHDYGKTVDIQIVTDFNAVARGQFKPKNQRRLNHC